MTAQEYANILGKIQLKGVVLSEVVASVVQQNVIGKNLSVDFKNNPFIDKSQEKQCPCITYVLTAHVTNETTPSINIKATFRVNLDCEDELPDEFFEFYKANLRLTTLPYVRELVASLTGRMGIPTLTIPYAVFHPTEPTKAKTKRSKPPTRKSAAKKGASTSSTKTAKS